jgi:hypothetical protein
MTAFVHKRRVGRSERLVVTLMGLEAASLAVMSSLHLTGTLADGSKPFQPNDAGIAEALICVALIGGAAALVCRWPNARAIALGTVAFAILGFVVGLNFTARGGHAIDIAYHATVLPLLLLTLFLVRRTPAPSTSPPQPQKGRPA